MIFELTDLSNRTNFWARGNKVIFPETPATANIEDLIKDFCRIYREIRKDNYPRGKGVRVPIEIQKERYNKYQNEDVRSLRRNVWGLK